MALRGLEMSVGGGTISARGQGGFHIGFAGCREGGAVVRSRYLKAWAPVCPERWKGLHRSRAGCGADRRLAYSRVATGRLAGARLRRAAYRHDGARTPCRWKHQPEWRRRMRGGRGRFASTAGSRLTPREDLDLSARGRLDLSVANSFLSAQGSSDDGGRGNRHAGNGAVAEPIVNGTLTLGGGSFRDALQGVRLDNIQARLTARGTDLMIERLSAATRNNGTISASGRVRLDPSAGFPGDIRITGQRAELVSNDLVTAVGRSCGRDLRAVGTEPPHRRSGADRLPWT